MADNNSQSKQFLLKLFYNVFLDLSTKWPQDSKSLMKDYEVLAHRVTCEGVSFLTSILPKLGKAFDQSLEDGFLLVPREFKRSHGNKTIPAFMQAMFRNCFDSDGRLANPSADLVRDMRHVFTLAYRLELPYTKRQESDVLHSFASTEEEIKSTSVLCDTPVMQGARELISEVVSGFNPKDIIPRHGPGAVATGEKGDEKWTFSRLYPALHQCFPYYDYFMIGSKSELIDRVKWYRSLDRSKDPQAKVVLVPKDSRGPRLISCEPLEIQYIQQGICRKLVPHLESHRLTRERVNFSFQDFNRKQALIGSIDRRNATIDLKDASDRVRLDVVEFLFKDSLLLPALLATRSVSTLLPTGDIVELSKFAPMGSALCFPVEALCFWAIAASAISTEFRIRLHKAGRLVYVYGDDIIVPRRAFECVTKALELAGLRVNRLKCFHLGFFRESCGCDAFKGNDVTPVKLRTKWTGKPSDGSALASYCSYANQFAQRGFMKTSAYLFELLESVYGKLPYGVSTSGYPCKWVSSKFKALILNLEKGFRLRWNDCHHSVQIKTNVLRTKSIDCTLTGWNRLLRNIVSPLLDRPDQVVLPRRTQKLSRWVDLF